MSSNMCLFYNLFHPLILIYTLDPMRPSWRETGEETGLLLREYRAGIVAHGLGD